LWRDQFFCCSLPFMLQRRFQASGLFAQPRDGFLLPGDLGAGHR
jgi:hypothetical protein